MGFRQLHSYPKVFNDQGNLKAFPFRRPLKVYFWPAFWVGTALYFLIDAYCEWTFSKYSHSQFFKQDKTQLLLRKRAFDTLILANKVQTSEEIVRQRSIF